jgi:predicted metal-dependent phosphoesterase TrpH
MVMIKIDLHIHTIRSHDAVTLPEEVIEAVRRRGLDMVAITDHNHLDGALALREMAPDMIIVGEEIRTTAGELIAYFLEEWVPPGLPLQETIERLRAQNAFISVPHPFDRLRRGAMHVANPSEILDNVDALEVFNARCIFAADNDRALALARSQGLQMTAGSDAHIAWEIGRAYVEMPPPVPGSRVFSSRDEFAASLAQGRVVGRLTPPPIHFFSAWNRLLKKTIFKTASTVRSREVK